MIPPKHPHVNPAPAPTPVPKPAPKPAPTPLPQPPKTKYDLPSLLFYQGDYKNSNVLDRADWHWAVDVLPYGTSVKCPPGVEDERADMRFQGVWCPERVLAYPSPYSVTNGTTTYGMATYKPTANQLKNPITESGFNNYVIDKYGMKPAKNWKMYNTTGCYVLCDEAMAKELKITVALPGPDYAAAFVPAKDLSSTWTVLLTNHIGFERWPPKGPSGPAPLWMVTISVYQWYQLSRAFTVKYSTTHDQSESLDTVQYQLVSGSNERLYKPLFSNGKQRTGASIPDVDTMRLVLQVSKATYCLGNHGPNSDCPYSQKQICDSAKLLWSNSQSVFSHVSGPANRAEKYSLDYCSMFSTGAHDPETMIGCPNYWTPETKVEGGRRYTSCTIPNNPCSGVKIYEDGWWNCNAGGICNAEALAEWMKKCNTYEWKTPTANAIATYAKNSI